MRLNVNRYFQKKRNLSMLNNLKAHFLCKTQKSLFAHIFSWFCVDISTKSDYNISTATRNVYAKTNEHTGGRWNAMALYIFLIVAGVAVMALGHYEKNKFVSAFTCTIGDVLFLLGFNFLLVWNPWYLWIRLQSMGNSYWLCSFLLRFRRFAADVLLQSVH